MKTMVFSDEVSDEEVLVLRPVDEEEDFPGFDEFYFTGHLVALLQIPNPEGVLLSRQDCYELAERLLRIARKAT